MRVFGQLCSPPTKTSPLLSSGAQRNSCFALDSTVLVVTTAPEGGSSALVTAPHVCENQNNRIGLRLRSSGRVLHPFNFREGAVCQWLGDVRVCACVSSMAPRAVWLLVALSAVLNVRSCCAFRCPAICRCSQHTFQCSRDTQLASRAAARAVARL